MSETKTEKKPEYKRKLMVRDLGNPADVTKKNKGGTEVNGTVYVHKERLVLGVVLGTVSKCSTSIDSAGNTHEVFMGDFMGTNEFGQAIYTSQQLELPVALVSILKTPLQNGPVEFALEMGVVRKPDSGLGWTWALANLVAPQPSDGVARLHKIVVDRYNPPQEVAPQEPAGTETHSEKGRKKAA